MDGGEERENDGGERSCGMSDEPLIPPSAQKLLMAEGKLLISLKAVQQELAKHGVPSLRVEGRPLTELYADQKELGSPASAAHNAHLRVVAQHRRD